MKLKYLVTLFFVVLVFGASGQTNNEAVLFTVGGDPVYASEFIKVYRKNLDLVQDESQKDVDGYLKLFTNYKLKLKEARALGLHKDAGYLRELNTYKKQLAQNYMGDGEVTEALVKEAYQRVSYLVNAGHILVKVSEKAPPKDTLEAYNKILRLRERALKEGFEKVRGQVHNGQTVFGEKLGYFSGFDMVYKFENAAYNTPVNEISQPFRTRFGYHIVKVLDKQKSQGEVKVAHIMLVERKNDSLGENPETKIQEIYKKIEQGEDFESLAKQFSDDKSSAVKGGVLAPFSKGQLRSKTFEDVAFGLKNTEDVSKPFKTEFGWHIVKLIEKIPVPDFESLKPELIEKIKRDSRSQLIDEALVNKLKSKYNIAKDQPNLDYFASILNEDYFKRTWKVPKDLNGEKPFLKIGSQQLTFRDFANYLENQQRNFTPKMPFDKLVKNRYEGFLKQNLIKYQEAHLESENQDYADIVAEYRDGLLLFKLMEDTIWNVETTDTVAIKDYYEANRGKYVVPKRVDAVVAVSQKQKTLKKVGKLLKKDTPLEEIKSLVNGGNNVEVIFTTGVMEAGHQALPEELELKKGISKIHKHNGTFVIVKINEVLPETPKTFAEAKGLVVADYQNYKEKNWLEKLAQKYPVKLDNNVLSAVKEELNK